MHSVEIPGFIATHTFYELNNETSIYFDNEEFYNLIFKTNKLYYLASREFGCYDTDPRCDVTNFSIAVINGFKISCYHLCNSYLCYPYTAGCLLRPIATIDNNNIEIKKNKNLESGTEELEIV